MASFCNADDFITFSGDNDDCGGILTSSSEFLMSESTQTNCQWIIRLDETKVIVFKILEIHFDENSICNEEYLRVNYDQKIFLIVVYDTNVEKEKKKKD